MISLIERIEAATGPDRPEWWVRKDGVLGCKRVIPDRVMQHWEAHPVLKGMVRLYVPACAKCPSLLAKEASHEG